MWIDLHNHVIPGVDDGARDAAEGRAGIAAFTAQGVEGIVATPHVDGSLTAMPAALEKRLAELDRGWVQLTAARGDGNGVLLDRGAEIKLDIPDVDLSDPRLRLGGGPTVLVEFPHFAVPPRSVEALGRIVEAGYRPLLAHPERYSGVDASILRSWVAAGAYMQVNAGSLTGAYGGQVARMARRIVQGGYAHCLASDFHCRGNPANASARSLLVRWGATEQARLLFDVNPQRLVDGDPPVTVQPIDSRAGGSVLMRVVRRLLPGVPPEG